METVIKNRGTSCVGVRKTGTTLIHVSTVMGTLYYMHKTMVESEGILKSESEQLQKVIKRVNKNYEYYELSPVIKGTFDFLKLVVDSWFKNV